MRQSNRVFIGMIAFAACALGIAQSSPAAKILPGLRGGDLTDPENDGSDATAAGTNFNATFAASEEASFDGPSEAAFNVFDNKVGGGEAKFCCGANPVTAATPITIDATITVGPQFLRSFTLTSGNDARGREPRSFQILGSNDGGANFTAIYTRADATTTPFTASNQTLEFTQGNDYPVQTQSYNMFRFIVTATGPGESPPFQLGEIEYFNTIPEPASLGLLAVAMIGVGLRRPRRQG